jgi:hypothetical protein
MKKLYSTVSVNEFWWIQFVILVSVSKSDPIVQNHLNPHSNKDFGVMKLLALLILEYHGG